MIYILNNKTKKPLGISNTLTQKHIQCGRIFIQNTMPSPSVMTAYKYRKVYYKGQLALLAYGQRDASVLPGFQLK